jgi:hypothetical protein
MTSESKLAWPKATGDYDKDCQLGCQYALDYLGDKTIEGLWGSGLMLQTVRKLLEEPDEHEGLAVGFFSMVGIAAWAGRWRAIELDAYWKRCRAERAEPKGKRRTRRRAKLRLIDGGKVPAPKPAA